MRSHLTRRVFRRISSNQPILHHDCLHSNAGARRTALRTTTTRGCTVGALRPLHQLSNRPTQSPTLPLDQRRSISIGDRFWPRGRDAKEANAQQLEPGVEELTKFGSSLAKGGRLPSEEDAAKAFNKYLGAKLQSDGKAEDSQVYVLREILNHLAGKKGRDGKFVLAVKDLQRALAVLNNGIRGDVGMVGPFAKAIYNELWSRKEELGLSEEDYAEDLGKVVRLLASSGRASEARQALSQAGGAASTGAWQDMLIAQAARGDEKELQVTLQAMAAAGIDVQFRTCELLARAYGHQRNMSQMKKWFAKAQEISDGRPMGRLTYIKTLVTAITQGDHSWGQDVIGSLVSNHADQRHTWDIQSMWILGTTKSTEEVKRKLKDATRSLPSYQPDSRTVNLMLSLAEAMKDAYMAERIMSLAAYLNVKPEATMYARLISTRLSQEDIDGAKAAYDQLVQVDRPDCHHVGNDALNNLIQAMGRSRRFAYDEVMAVVQTLVDRSGLFDAQTVSVLVPVHLEREEYRELVDLLNANIFHYSDEESNLVQNAFVTYFLDRNNKVDEIWQAYQIYDNLFDGIDRDVRTRIMKEFFTRRRGDLARYVFLQMTSNLTSHSRPNEETLVQAFLGAARIRDNDSLEVAKNQLRVLSDVQMSTRLSNAMMMAHTAAGSAEEAFSIWDNLINSIEGPSFSSIQIAFRACEASPFGAAKAREIWTLVRRLDLAVSSDLLASYVGALAGSAEFDDVVKELQRAQKKGMAMDAQILGTFFNATNGADGQKRVQEYISHAHPEVWAQLEKIGIRQVSRMVTRAVQITRHVEP